MRTSLSVAGYPAESGSGGALFAETPNGLGADGYSLYLTESKVTIWWKKFITLPTTVTITFGATLINSKSKTIQDVGLTVLILAFHRDCKAAAASASGESAIDSQTVPRHKRRPVRTQP